MPSYSAQPHTLPVEQHQLLGGHAHAQGPLRVRMPPYHRPMGGIGKPLPSAVGNIGKPGGRRLSASILAIPGSVLPGLLAFLTAPSGASRVGLRTPPPLCKLLSCSGGR